MQRRVHHLLRLPQVRSHGRDLVLLVGSNQTLGLLQPRGRDEQRPSPWISIQSRRKTVPSGLLTEDRRYQQHGGHGPSRTLGHIERQAGREDQGVKQTWPNEQMQKRVWSKKE